MAIVQLRTRPERLREDQAAILRQALLPFEAGELAPHVRLLITQIDRQQSSRNRWTFVMLSPSQNAAVVNYLIGQSSRPMVAVRLWALCFEHLRQDTGEITLRRDEMADQLGETAANVSRVMSELEHFGAISRRRVKVGGLKGPGMVIYSMNPRVGTHLAGKERDDAQAAAPQLRLIDGGNRGA